MFERIDRVIVPVPNVKRAADWYESELEFRIARIRGKEIDLQVHKGQTLLTLTENPDTAGHHPLAHLHRGVTADVCAEQDGVCRFHVRSPEGLLIRILEKETVKVG